jgi:hypothetical protein
MEVRFGNGGWILVEHEELPGPLYLRLRQDADGRWVTTELYLDARGGPITAAALRELPISSIEAAVQANERSRIELDDRSRVVAVDLSTAASYYATTFGRQADHWVADMLRAQVPGSEVPKPSRRKSGIELQRPEVPPLRRPPDGRLTDDFLRQVARSYDAALRRGARPAIALADEADVPAQTIRRWVYLARKRGIMPPGRQGKAG